MSGKESGVKQKRALLKKSIIKFLDTKCPDKRCLKAHFWNELSVFLKKSLSHKQYGVSKLSLLLPVFSDVLYCDEHFVNLRLETNQDNAKPVTISDDSDSEEVMEISAISSSAKQGATPWGAGLIPTDEQRASKSVKKKNETSSIKSSSSDFLSFSDTTQSSQDGSGQLSHQRYGLGNSSNNSSGSQSFSNSPFLIQAMAQNFMSQFEASRPVPSQSSNVGAPLLGQPLIAGTAQPRPQGQPNVMTSTPMTFRPSPEIVPSPLPMTPRQLQQNQMSGSQPVMSFMPPNQHQSPVQNVMPGPATQSPNVVFPKAPPSEWPQQPARTGPPPGTKITETVPEVIVRPIKLPPGSRLTSQQVNSEIKICRELLSDAGEHVSIDRVQNLVLQKFQVREFRMLNLRERYFDNLQEARDLSMAIGKVNSYIQNFVRSRSLCTLFELQECLREFESEKKTFEHLKLGPLQKMPLVYDMFKFPYDEYIPEITAVDLMVHLKDYLNKFQKWQTQTNMQEFMTYLVEDAYKVESGFSLGIRLRSLPLAIQTLKKSERDAAATRRHVVENLRQILNQDVEEAFAKFRAHLLQTNEEGKHQLRLHYMDLTPEVALEELFSKFRLLSHICGSDANKGRKTERMLKAFHTFCSAVLDVPIPRMLYHLSVCLSNLEVRESAASMMAQESQLHQQQEEACMAVWQQQEQKRNKTPPTKSKLAEKVHTYMNKCIESDGQLQLSHLKNIESKLLEDFGFHSFGEMGYGQFLEMLLKEPKLNSLLEECGGTSLGSGAKGHHNESLYRPSLSEIQELLCQANHAGLSQPQQMETVMCEQYGVTDVRQLSHGSNIGRLWKSAQSSRKHASREQSVHFEAPLCGKLGRTTKVLSGQVGMLGSQTREAAQACLTLCPLLDDMALWSQWGLVFQQQHGPLREFVEKHGGQKIITLKGKNGVTATSDFMALEIEPGKLLKVCTSCGPDQFLSALENNDPMLAAGYLVSLIAMNKGVEGAPLALLANHVKTKLLALHAHSSSLATPGAPPTLDSFKNVDLAVNFVTDMMLKIPLRICVAIAEQVLLKPLWEVVGSDKAKEQVVQACHTRPGGIHSLERLGCLLGITEWTSTLQVKLEFPAEYCITEAESQEEDMFGFVQDEVREEDEEEDEDDEEDASEDESDIDDILSEGQTSAETEDSKDEETEEISPSEDKSKLGKEELSKDEENVATSAEAEKGDYDTGIKIPEEGSSSSDEEDSSSDNTDDDKDDIGEENVDSSGKAPEGDENVNEVGEAMEKMLAVSDEEKEPTVEELCRAVVDTIRKEEFGVGIELGETEQKLMLKQQERQGRSLQRLSKDLYSKDTHFVLELIQNADDNSYPEAVTPSVKFVIDDQGVKVMNNETGFESKNIQALCDVGKSTKTKHTIGYIGQKGIGFKSVFRVTGRPEVHSNGFHICFDVDSGPMGYILPHWIEAPPLSEMDDSWQTQISLPWTDEIKQQLHTHAARFNDIKPSLLLFLHRLKQITIDNKVDCAHISMLREDLGDGEIHISHSGKTDRWLVVRKLLDASKISLQTKAGVEVQSTEIALAFPLRRKGMNHQSHMRPPMLPVFAFLPLRNYGFRFIVQGDFDVPSSREDVDRDSSWNQWLRGEIHTLFIQALESFKERPDLSHLDALVQYLQFVPLEDEVVDFFKPVTTHILAQLRGSKCLPVLTSDKKGVDWKFPPQCVLAQDPLMQQVVSPDLLQQKLGLFYLHPTVATALGDHPLASVLGVRPISTSDLLDIGRHVAPNWTEPGTPEQVMEISKWLACVYRSLDDFQENTEILEELSSMRITPLADGRLVALSSTAVFLLAEDSGSKSKQASKRDHHLQRLQQDLSIIHPALTNTPDDEVNSQVVKLLMKTGTVKQLTPHDLVHSHILPVFRSDSWKEKRRETLISYLAYIKTEYERQSSLIEISDLKAVVKLVTNHGNVSLSESSVHFSPAFGNKIDLMQVFPGIKWTLVDSAYMSSNPTPLEKQSWHNFLTSLGVVDFLHVKKKEAKFDKSNIDETPWALYKNLWPDSQDGYTIMDFECEEFHQLVTLTQNDQHQQSSGIPHDMVVRQMSQLYELLDSQWEVCYSKFVPTQLRSGSGELLKESIETSFALNLKALTWIPAEWKDVEVAENGKDVLVKSKRALCHGSDLYLDCPSVRERLAHTVKYLHTAAQRDSKFSAFLGIIDRVSVQETAKKFLSWCERDPAKPKTPAVFCTTKNHILELYNLFTEELSGKDAQDMFHNHPAIFVPLVHDSHEWMGGQSLVVGKMLAREEVWWNDPTGLLLKYAESLQKYGSHLGLRRIICPYYNSISEQFRNAVRPEMELSLLQLAELLKHIADTKTLHEDGVLADTLSLFSHIGSRLAMSEETKAEVPTQRASIAKMDLKPVVNMLSSAAVFPSKQYMWVNPGQQILMLADSPQLEDLFASKPGVHFLLTEVKGQGHTGGTTRGRRNNSSVSHNKESIDYFVSLFETIKPLTKCVSTQEITTGFQQSIYGQTYLHKVVGLIQCFLFFDYPEVYNTTKNGRAEALKDLKFIEVERLEAKYELEGRPDIFVIRPEKCMVQDNMFYLSQSHASNTAEINREVAKYFSGDSKECARDLMSFLQQLVPILEGKSAEPMEEFLHRLDVEEMPKDHEIWGVPLPIIQKPEPEPEPEPLEEEVQMVYGRAVDSVRGSDVNAEAGSENTDQGLKCWPPRSALMVDADPQARPKQDGERKTGPAGMWPPPQPPNPGRAPKGLPSNIRVEKEESENSASSTDKIPRSGDGIVSNFSRTNSYESGSQTGDQRGGTGTKQPREETDRDGVARGEKGEGRQEGKGGTRYEGDKQGPREGKRDGEDDSSQQKAGGQPTGINRQHSQLGDASSGEKRKRTDSESPRDGEPAQSKKPYLTGEENEPFINKDNEHQGDKRGDKTSSHKDHGDKRTQSNCEDKDVAMSPPGSRRESPTKQAKDRQRLHLTIPIWTDQSQDLDYTDLSKAVTCDLPSLDLETGDPDFNLEVGRWGELLVHDYLTKLKMSEPQIEAVLWANAEGEKGLPWDFEVVYSGMQESYTVYIEVKATASQDKEIFEVSPRQLELAMSEGPNFHVYRVFGAGRPGPRLLRVENVAERLSVKQLRLFMLL